MVLRDFPFAQSYIDDILVASRSEAEHLDRLLQVFQKLEEHNLRLRSDKYTFFQREGKYIGIEVSASGFRPLPAKVRAIDEFPEPRNVRGLKRCLGMTAFYHRFIARFSELAAPLTDLTRGLRRPSLKSPLVWTA